MRQSHDGAGLPPDQWDDLKIIVDKTTTPYTVSYHQLKDGEEIEYKAACFGCHNNGPRAIRPKDFSKLEALDQLKIITMNLRIKTYGRIKLKPDWQIRRVPIAFNMRDDWDELNVKTCVKCHSETGFLARGKLKKQQAPMIDHLVKTGAMPPWPYQLSAKEEKQLKAFTARTH